jgi:hypothetical protein
MKGNKIMTIPEYGHEIVPFNQAEIHKQTVLGFPIEVHTAPPGTRINILSELKYPEEFYADPNVHQVVRFGGAYETLIGEYHGQFGPWEREKLPDKKIFILEDHFQEAANIIERINTLAPRFVNDSHTYEDKGACDEFYLLAKLGYDFIANKRKWLRGQGLPNSVGKPVSLERGGLVATRLGMQLDQDSTIADEIRVVTKRVHLKEEPDTHLAVTVTWRDEEVMSAWIPDNPISVFDYVNPASGASLMALIHAGAVMLEKMGEKPFPKRIDHISISATQQGILSSRQEFGALGIDSTFVSLGYSKVLNKMYYLTDKPVADAGHALRSHLPNWYRP